MDAKPFPRWASWLWLTIFTVGPLLFDGFLLWGVVRQLSALGYPTVPGVVTHSQVRTESDDDGFSHTPDVRYQYTVQGVVRTGTVYRYFLIGSDDSAAYDVVKAHPVGRHVEVHYNPADPNDAVIQAGLSGGGLFMALFLLPFNVAMVGAWALIGLVLWRSRKAGPFAAFKVSRRGSRLFIHLDDLGLTFSAVTAFGVSIVLVIVIGIFFGSNPPLLVMVGAWVVVLAASLAVYFLDGPAGEGLRQLELDDADGSMTLYRRTRRAPDAVAYDRDVKDVVVEAREIPPGKEVKKSYVTLLIFRDDGGLERQEVLTDQSSQDVAEALAAGVREWLAGRGCLKIDAEPEAQGP